MEVWLQGLKVNQWKYVSQEQQQNTSTKAWITAVFKVDKSLHNLYTLNTSSVVIYRILLAVPSWSTDIHEVEKRNSVKIYTNECKTVVPAAHQVTKPAVWFWKLLLWLSYFGLPQSWSRKMWAQVDWKWLGWQCSYNCLIEFWANPGNKWGLQV